MSIIFENKDDVINKILDNAAVLKKEILLLKYNPSKLYNKYTNINCVKYSNETGDLFKCLEYSNFNYKLVNKLLFNLDINVIKNLYRYIWVNFKLFKEHISKNWSNHSEDITYKYIMSYQLLHYKEYYKTPELFMNYHNFVYNNLYTDNEILSIYLYNMVCDYLI